MKTTQLAFLLVIANLFPVAGLSGQPAPDLPHPQKLHLCFGQSCQTLTASGDSYIGVPDGGKGASWNYKMVIWTPEMALVTGKKSAPEANGVVGANRCMGAMNASKDGLDNGRGTVSLGERDVTMMCSISWKESANPPVPPQVGQAGSSGTGPAPPAQPPSIMRLCTDHCETLTRVNDHYEGVKDGEQATMSRYTVERWQTDGVKLTGIHLKTNPNIPDIKAVFTGKISPAGGAIVDPDVEVFINGKQMYKGPAYVLTWQTEQTIKPQAVAPSRVPAPGTGSSPAQTETTSQAGPSTFTGTLAACDDEDGCTSWTFDHGIGKADWPEGGTKSALVLQSFDSERVSIGRRDTAGKTTGLAGVYNGTRKGDLIDGLLDVTWPGHGTKAGVPWHAIVRPLPSGQDSPSRVLANEGLPTGWLVCEGGTSSCISGKTPPRYVWTMGMKADGVKDLLISQDVIQLKVDSLDAENLVFRRVVTSGPSSGMTALYKGTRHGSMMSGTVTWIWPSNTVKPINGVWVALMSERTCDPKLNRDIASGSEVYIGAVAFMLGENDAGFQCNLIAAQRGDPFAEASVGEMYMTGSGVAKDKAKALFWTEKAAVAESSLGARNYAIMLALGYGTPVEENKANYWFVRHDYLLRRAAQARRDKDDAETGGEPASPLQFNLGLIASLALDIAFEKSEKKLDVAVVYLSEVLKNMNEGAGRIQAEDKSLEWIQGERQKVYADCISRRTSNESSESALYRRQHGGMSPHESAEASCFVVKDAAITEALNSYNRCIHANVGSMAIEKSCRLLP